MGYFFSCISDVRPITPPDDKAKKHAKAPERKIIVTGDTDLILKHLFADVDDKKGLTSSGTSSTTNNSNVAHLKRGRYELNLIKFTLYRPTKF